MMETVRKLNEAGITLFRGYLQELRGGGKEAPPVAILTSPETSTPLAGGAQVDQRHFGTRYQAAEYLMGALTGRVERSELDHGPGVWSWLSLFYFDQLCPPQADGRRKVGKDYRYILPPLSDPEHFRQYYRHLLAGSFRILRQHRGAGRVLLAGAPDKFDDFNEQIASRLELASNLSVMAVLDVLYLDAETRRAKRGAASNKRKPGTLRRFIDVLQQLDLTYDLYALTAEELLALLPAEFQRWSARNHREALGER